LSGWDAPRVTNRVPGLRSADVTDEIRTFELSFRLESGDGGADLERSAAVVCESVAALADVEEVSARVADQVRAIDPVSVTAVVLSVTATIKGAAAATKALDDLVNNIKQLARDAGLPQLWIWVGRKRVKAEDVTQDDLKELVAEED
jgi:hypothetical protein